LNQAFDNLSFTSEEWTPYIAVVSLVMLILILNYAKGFREFWSPLTLIAVIYGYYCCLGPYQAVTSGDTYDRLVNMRPFYVSALWGAFVSLLFYVIGFNANRASIRRPIQAFPPEALFTYGRNMLIIGFILFTISTGGNVAKLINPLDAQYVGQQGGSIANYLGLSLNFMIPGLALLFAYVVTTRNRILWFIIPFAISMGIFISLGFRYRLILLLGSMAIIYYYTVRKKPNLIVAPLAIFALIAFMGIINISRQYGAGLNTSKLEGGTSVKYYQSGLRESLIFQTSGAVIDIVPEKHPYAGFEPIWSTLLFPIPSAIFPEKKSSEYLFNALDAIYGKKVSQGAAMMAYGEYYLAFGWLGLMLGSFITGWFYKKLWIWYKSNHANPFVIVVYAVTVTYLYVIISRGYLPQVTMLFFFTVFPTFFVLWLAKKKYPFVRVKQSRSL
jgi:oligosaccharide repeat unit polymerase